MPDRGQHEMTTSQATWAWRSVCGDRKDNGNLSRFKGSSCLTVLICAGIEFAAVMAIAMFSLARLRSVVVFYLEALSARA